MIPSVLAGFSLNISSSSSSSDDSAFSRDFDDFFFHANQCALYKVLPVYFKQTVFMNNNFHVMGMSEKDINHKY